ncbi:MAG: OsmC family protein [Spirochaetes bacterium]|jgi:putative redox protein|nr:OsmC family protein [Spirochaetota bacterium]
MKIIVAWNDKMQFEGSGETVSISAKMDVTDREMGGEGKGQTPKQLFLQSIAGCTGMDVIFMLNRMRAVLPEKFIIEVNAFERDEDPKVFTKIDLTYRVEGDVDRGRLIKAVRLSQDTYCSIGAMVKKACELNWSVFLNGEKID